MPKLTYNLQTIGVIIAFLALLVGIISIIPPAELTAEFLEKHIDGLDADRKHHGSKRDFTVQVKFSEPISTRPRFICKSADFDNAKCTDVRRVIRKKNRLWEITVLPLNDYPVTLDFKKNELCDGDKRKQSICTAEGKMLKHVKRLCIPGSYVGCNG